MGRLPITFRQFVNPGVNGVRTIGGAGVAVRPEGEKRLKHKLPVTRSVVFSHRERNKGATITLFFEFSVPQNEIDRASLASESDQAMLFSLHIDS